MSEHDLEKLLGGFAADTLTAEEKQQLYSAALHDQDLFNALADEQTLKELLSDPVVRCRLLQSLQTTSSTTAGSSPSWLEWFRRPAGLAWAGGFAAAIFAVVLGTRIYQDSVKEAGRSVATEEATPAAPTASAPSVTQPAAPLSNESRSNAQDHEKLAASPRKEAPAGKTAKRETTATVKPQERHAQDSSSDSPLQQHEVDVQPRPAESTRDTLARSKEGLRSSTDQTLAANSAKPTTTTPESKQLQDSANPPSAGLEALPRVGARALFYGHPTRKGTPEPSASTGGQQQARTEERQNTVEYNPLLGLRIQVLGDLSKPNSEKTVTIETNQPGYLLVWSTNDDGVITFLFPQTGTLEARASFIQGHSPVKVIAPPEGTFAHYNYLRLYFGRSGVPPFDDLKKMAQTPGYRYDLEYSKYSDDARPGEKAAYYVTSDSSIFLWDPQYLPFRKP